MGSKKFLTTLLILFAAFKSSAQVDTTGFTFLVETDSSAGFVQKNLIVSIDDQTLGGIHRISLELLFQESEGFESLVAQQEFFVTDISSIINQSGELILTQGQTGFTYTLVIKLYDENGHQLITLNKTLLS